MHHCEHWQHSAAQAVYKMKAHPFRGAQVGKHILRERITAKIAASSAGVRVIRQCQAALDRPVNSDPTSQKLVLQRYAIELDLFPAELEELLRRKHPDNEAAAKARKKQSQR